MQSWWDKLKNKRKATADDGYSFAGIYFWCTYYWNWFWHWTLSKMSLIDTKYHHKLKVPWFAWLRFDFFFFIASHLPASSSNNPYPVILLASLSLKHLKRPVSSNFHPNWAQSNRTRTAHIPSHCHSMPCINLPVSSEERVDSIPNPPSSKKRRASHLHAVTAITTTATITATTATNTDSIAKHVPRTQN